MPRTPKKAAKKTPVKAAPAAVPQTKRSAQAERKRQRLLEAAIEVLLDEGMAKFTSARIAEAAGMHKPAFYSVFKSADECLTAIASHVAATNVREVLAQQDKLIESPRGAADTSQPHPGQQVVAHMLQVVSQQKSVYRLLRRFKDQDGPLGDAVREIDAYVQARSEERFWRLAVQFGIDPRHFREVGQMAYFIVTLHYEAGARVLNGSVSDIDVEAARVWRYVHAIVSSEFKRMLAEQKPA
jgi:AcrR family transcriptional regulator